MSGPKQLIAGILCLLWITNLQAFHYPIYKPVVSTAYLAGNETANQNQLRSIINRAKTPSLIVINNQEAKTFSVSLQNVYHSPIAQIKMIAPKGKQLTIQSDTCRQKDLLPNNACEFHWLYNPTKASLKSVQRTIIPFILQYHYKGHDEVKHIKILAVQMPNKTFYKAPVQEFPAKDGIGSNYVRSLYLGPRGHLFVGNYGGLSEGVDHNHYFKNINSVNGLGNNAVTAVIKDPSGTIYVGTDGGGLAISNDNGLTFINKTVKNGLAGNHVSSLFWKDHALFIGTNHGLSISHDQGDHFINKGMDAGLNSLMINQIIADHRGHLLLATDNGLAESSNEGSSFYNKTIDNGLGDNAINAIIIDKNNVIYAGTEHGLSVSKNDGKQFVNYTKANGILSDRILSLAINPANQDVYIGTDCGLIIEKAKNHAFMTSPGNKATQNNAINAIQINPKKSIAYLALGGNGLGILNTYNHKMRFIKTNQVADNLLSGLWVQNNQVDVATASGLSESVDGGKVFSTWNPNHTIYATTAFYEGDNAKIYLGTNRGLFVHGPHGGDTMILANDQINSIAQNRKNKQLFIATNRGVIISDNNGQHLIQHTIDDGLGSDKVHQVAYDPILNIIYAATSHGLSYSRDGGHSFTNALLPKDTTSNVLDIAITPLGAIFVGTDHGLYKGYWLNHQLQWRQLTVKQAVTSLDYNNLKAMLIVGCKGELLLSNDGGDSFAVYKNGLKNKTIVGANILANDHALLVATRQHGLWESYFK